MRGKSGSDLRGFIDNGSQPSPTAEESCARGTPACQIGEHTGKSGERVRCRGDPVVRVRREQRGAELGGSFKLCFRSGFRWI